MPPTPEFIRWAIERPCPLREYNDWKDPEVTERQLRALREYSQSAADGRVFEGICVHPSVSSENFDVKTAKGFYANEIVDVYGGESFVHSLCDGCPANAISLLGGCFGYFEWSQDGEAWLSTIDNSVAELGIQKEIREHFLPTKPTWYGLWTESPLNKSQVELLEPILRLASEMLNDQSIIAFVDALDIARTNDLAMRVTYFPRGTADELKWQVAAHCPRCKYEMSQQDRKCAACGRTGFPNASRKRNVRGSRPFRLLASFLGESEAATFLQRYVARKCSVDL